MPVDSTPQVQALGVAIFARPNYCRDVLSKKQTWDQHCEELEAAGLWCPGKKSAGEGLRKRFCDQLQYYSLLKCDFVLECESKQMKV